MNGVSSATCGVVEVAARERTLRPSTLLLSTSLCAHLSVELVHAAVSKLHPDSVRVARSPLAAVVHESLVC